MGKSYFLYGELLKLGSHMCGFCALPFWIGCCTCRKQREKIPGPFSKTDAWGAIKNYWHPVHQLNSTTFAWYENTWNVHAFPLLHTCELSLTSINIYYIHKVCEHLQTSNSDGWISPVDPLAQRGIYPLSRRMTGPAPLHWCRLYTNAARCTLWAVT